MSDEPNPSTVVRRRQSARNVGLALMLIGVLVGAMSPLPIPIPTRVIWLEIVAAVVIALIGVAIFVRSHRVPVQEILVLARELGGAVTQANLAERMGFDPANAAEILDKLAGQGVLRREEAFDRVGRRAPRYVVPEPQGKPVAEDD
ncbi:MAG TPA: MarR family transcriptional regulator [Planctomycetota bacterium]|nr:MarR family transcriptional regulator [Planctomycetota bacterium]